MLLLERCSNLSFLGLLLPLLSCQQQEAWRTGLLDRGKWVILPLSPTHSPCSAGENLLIELVGLIELIIRASCSLALISSCSPCPILPTGEFHISAPQPFLILASFQDSIQVPSLEVFSCYSSPAHADFIPTVYFFHYKNQCRNLRHQTLVRPRTHKK